MASGWVVHADARSPWTGGQRRSNCRCRRAARGRRTTKASKRIKN